MFVGDVEGKAIGDPKMIAAQGLAMLKSRNLGLSRKSKFLPSPRLSGAKSKETIGIAILSALSITSVWSSICPSYFTFSTFASRPEARDRAMTTCWIGFGLSTAAAAAIYFVFDELVPAIVAEATAVALLGISMHAINSPPPETIPPMERQSEAV